MVFVRKDKGIWRNGEFNLLKKLRYAAAGTPYRAGDIKRLVVSLWCLLGGSARLQGAGEK